MFSDLSGLRGRNADAQAAGDRRQPQGEGSDDAERQPQGDTTEAAAAGVVELAELGDGRRWGLDAGGQGHRVREREQDRDEGAVAPGAVTRPRPRQPEWR